MSRQRSHLVRAAVQLSDGPEYNEDDDVNEDDRPSGEFDHHRPDFRPQRSHRDEAGLDQAGSGGKRALVEVDAPPLDAPPLDARRGSIATKEGEDAFDEGFGRIGPAKPPSVKEFRHQGARECF